jgi:hypothetical protein
MVARRLAPTLILVAACALVFGAQITRGAVSLFSDSDSVTGNSFATCSQFPPESAVARLGSWTTGLSHTAAAGTDRLLVFAVGYENGADPGVSAVSYGGQSLTRVTGAVAGTSIFARVELWYLNEAGIAAATGTTFSVTWGGATPSQPMYAAATFANVNQGAPIGNSSTAFTDSSTPNPITTSVSVTSGSMAVSAAISGNNGSYTWNNGWTEGSDQTAGSTTTMSSAEHAASAAGTDTASATHSSPNRQAIVAATLSPVPTAVARVGSWTTGLSHTASAGTDRLLVFVVGYENGADPGVSAVSYGGQSLTRVAGAVAGTSFYGRVELWYLKEAGILAASGATFSVTWGGSTPSDPMYAAATFEGVSQCNPIGDSSTAFTNSSTPNPITTSVSVANGSMAVSGAISGNSGSYTWNNGWTEGSDQTSGATTTMSSAEHAATGPGTDTASATHSGPNRQAIVAAALNRSLAPCSAGDTGWLDPASQAADTGGDGDGFELSPTNAFSDGGGNASNMNGAADRHRYYTYGVSIPTGCSVVGIEARLDWWLDSTFGANSMSVELSWDGGTSWTAAYTDSVETTTEHTGTLGGASDTWSRSWTATDLNDANFRLRITSNSGSSSRDFFLDWAPIRVSYQ